MGDSIVTADYVRQLVNYDPDTGIFTRKVRLAQRHNVGDRADFLVKDGKLKGYCRISFRSKRYLAHRVAWLYVYGEWPVDMIDHINQIKSDNRISNLRQADGYLNQQNIDKAQVNSSSGFRGARFHKATGKWRVRIGFNGQYYEFGLYDSKELAHSVYNSAKKALQDGCSHEQAKYIVRAGIGP